MARLLYFRHAQASYGKPNYDQLSELGYRQSEILGNYLVENEVKFDHIYVGPLQRQIQTTETVVKAYSENGVSLPDPIEIKELEEHKGPSILKAMMRQIKNEDALIHQWDEQRLENPELNVKNGLRIFDRAMELWATGQLNHLQPSHYLNWKEFRKQVNRGYDDILNKHRNERGVTIGLFTSGGTISATMGRVLGIAEERNVIRLNAIVQNTSMSEILFTEDKETLKSFNEVPHLSDDMRTFV